MTTTFLQSIEHTVKASGALIADYLNGLPPDKMERLQALLGAGYHLGVRVDFAAEGLVAVVFADNPDLGETIPLQAATVPAAQHPTH